MTDARDGYAPLWEAMRGLYFGLIDSGSAKLAASHRRAGHLAHGWYLRCERSLDALLLLEKSGYAEEAAPLRRCVIEHVVALKWLAAEGNDVIDTIARGHAEDARRRLGAVTAARWTSVDRGEIQAIIDEIRVANHDPSNDYLLNFAQRLNRYGDVHDLPGYLAETALGHPTYQSAINYCDISSGSVEVTLEPHRSVAQTPFATTQLLEALLALREVFDPKPWERELTEILDRYRSVTDAVRGQDGLPPVDWTTGRAVDSDVG